jgi:hypothetical protein
MSVRSRRFLVLPVAAAALAFIALPGGSPKSAASGVAPSQAITSADYWAAHRESESPLKQGAANGIYEGANDQNFLKLVGQAQALPQYLSKSWKSVGPFNGVKSIPSVGSGAELFGAIGGIGTAIAADPSDASGNTAYLGTHGGLWKTTDGGTTVKELSAGFARAAVGAIAIDPRDPRTVYVGTGASIATLSDDAVGTGVYVSHNAGQTFSRPALNTRGYGVNAIAVSPTTGTVLVGTNYGLWRSTNSGASFLKVPLKTNATHTAETPHPLGNWVTSIVYRPGVANEVTLAVGYFRGKKPLPDGTVLAPGNGLYRSLSDGAPGTFTYLPSTATMNTSPAASSDPIGRISLAYGASPGQGNVLWALVQDAGRAAGQTLADTPALPVVSLTGGSVLNGVYRSIDDGATWRFAASPQTLTTALTCSTCVAGYPISYAAGVQSQYNNWIATDPVNPNRVYVGLEEAFQGDVVNIGPQPVTSWHAMERYANLCGFLLYPNSVPGQNSVSCPQNAPFYGGGSTHPDQHAASLVTTPAGVRLYAGNDGGWWVQDSHTITPDHGVSIGPGFDNVSWRDINKPATVLPWDVNFLQNGDIILALQDNGTVHLKKDGSAYNVCGGDGVYALPGANSDSYYCGIPGQTLLATTDDFKHTILASPGTAGAGFLSPVASDLTDPNHLMAAASEIRETTAGPNSNTYDPTTTLQLASTWTSVFTPPAPTDPALVTSTGAAIPWDSSALSVTGPVGYVAFCAQCRPSLSLGPAITDPSHVHAMIATNVKLNCAPKKANSACWHTTASKGLPHQQVSGIAVDPKDARTIYVSLRQYIVLGADPNATGFEKVMVSHDAGEHFTDISGNLPRADAHSIVLRDNRLVVATDVGIFTSTVGSTSWTRLGKGLPAVVYRVMRIDRTGRNLVAGAYGRGAYTFDFGSAAVTPPTVIPKLPRTPSLATTGNTVALPIFGGLLLAAVLLVVRRRRARTEG